MKTRLLTSNLSYPIGSFPSQIPHLSCPSVQHENLPDGHPLELRGACSTDAYVRKFEEGDLGDARDMLQCACLPSCEIGNFNSPMVHEGIHNNFKECGSVRVQ